MSLTLATGSASLESLAKSEWQDRALHSATLALLTVLLVEHDRETCWRSVPSLHDRLGPILLLWPRVADQPHPQAILAVRPYHEDRSARFLEELAFFADWSGGADFFYRDNAFNRHLGLGFFSHPLL